MPNPELKEIHFTVDSELLRELGERLVGRQYIALAELVKNSYDADASRVEIRIQDDCIEVSDNGHGMTYEDFESDGCVWVQLIKSKKKRRRNCIGHLLVQREWGVWPSSFSLVSWS